MKLHIDALTASVALKDLSERGNTLETLAQALDEDWKRYAVDPKTGTRHLISTMGNRQDAPATGLAYYNTGLIQPGRIDAAERSESERFLKGKPLLCAELAQEQDGYRLGTVLLRVSFHIHAVIDREREAAMFYIQFAQLPETVMNAATGRRLDEIIDIGHLGNLLVRSVRTADESEMRKVLGHISMEGILVETDLPEWIEVDFEEVYHKPFFS